MKSNLVSGNDITVIITSRTNIVTLYVTFHVKHSISYTVNTAIQGSYTVPNFWKSCLYYDNIATEETAMVRNDVILLQIMI